MLKIINDLPGNVLGISAEGKITGTDYETVLIPAIEKKLKENKMIRLLYHLDRSFTGFDFGAMLDDARVGMKHFSSWEKIALVSDRQLINSLVKFCGFMMHCDVRIFKDAELAEAKSRIIEK